MSFLQVVIYNTVRSAKLAQWLEPDGITKNIDTNEDMGSVFSADLDEDYDRMTQKVTQRHFSRVYLSWIKYCAFRLNDKVLACTSS